MPILITILRFRDAITLLPLQCDALMMALTSQDFPKGVIMHIDRGSQYCSKQYRKIIVTHKLIGSMSRKGNCWDNAIAESFFHSLKVELVYQQVYKTRDMAKQSVFHYIETYYNRRRLHSATGGLNAHKKVSVNSGEDQDV